MSRKLLVLSLILFLLPVVRLDACSCQVLTLCERLDQTPVIFLGEVVEGGVAPKENPWHSKAGAARLKVIEAFRGISKDTQVIPINLSFLPGMCSPNPYFHGQQVLVFAQPKDGTGTLQDGGCTQSVRGEQMAEELSTVRKYFSGAMQTEIYGRVAPNTDADLVDYVLGTKQTLPLTGVTVIAQALGKKYQAVSDVTGAIEKFGEQASTDAQGAFRFAAIDPGEYSLVVSPAGETADSPYPRTRSTTPIKVEPTSTLEGLTLALPPPIATRSIRIHITGADGKPLSEGSVICAQAAKEGEGYPMSRGLRPKRDGTTCHALSDRTYHIRLERTTTHATSKLTNPPEAFVAPGLDDTDVHLQIPQSAFRPLP